MQQILQICPHDSSPFGELCDRYRNAAESIGCSVVTVYLSEPSGTAKADSTYLGIQELAGTTAIRAAMRPLAKKPWDLVICHRYRSYRAAASVGLASERCVVVAHEYGLLTRWQRRLHRRMFSRACRFAGIAPALAAELGLVTGETLVLPNVLDVDAVSKQFLSQVEAREKLGLESGDLTIGVVGRLHYKKRPELALEAFKMFAESCPDSRLVFLGDGEERAKLERQAVPNVQLLGNVPDAMKIFKAFDVVLHTAKVESFGMVVLEAMLAGVPVVALRGYGPEFVLDDLGFYTENDTAGAFASALSDAISADRSELAQKGVARAEQHFSVQCLARKLSDLLD
ncbi:MAG: glycosyltransferase [Pseudomonadales bacterium]|nr:glycosyltransferase [Pseudomonadales bacterium]